EQRMAEKRSALQLQIARGGPAALEAAERLDSLQASGRLMPAEERRLALGSRSAKDTLVTAGDLDHEWWQTSVQFGFDARSVEQLRGLARQHEHPSDIAEALLRRLTEFDATFAPREARATALEVAPDLGPEHGLAALDGLRERGELLDLADGRMTTRAHRALERQTVALGRELAGARTARVDEQFTAIETEALRLELAEHGATLAPEQEEAIALACADHQLVVIVGQAGTGKSTALLGVARAHEQDGRRVLVTSTGAQAAERLALELQAGGVEARGYSTAALRASVEHGRLPLDGGVSILHDEAALASTREQRWLYGAARESGARLVAIGDPRQSQAVGAGGLWGKLEELAREQGAYVELTRIVRAREPADRRDQALFRAGKHERAIEGYAERGRVLFEADQRRAEDRALEAAQADRSAERSTLVIAESTNERLDMLNARAQAIRAQEGELGHERIALKGRPYGLSAGDEIVVRAPVRHPELGPVRNGTTAEVLQVDSANEHAMLRLADGREARFQRELLDAGQTRLAYVSHPFPVQGRTSDTVHVIAGPHSSAEGSYVGLTRAREQTRLYAARDQLDLAAKAPAEREISALAERLGRSEPEVPSISVPLVGERHIEREHARQTLPAGGDQGTEALERLRAERAELRALLATYPSHAAERIRHHEQRDAEARDAVARARERADQLRQEIDQMSRWQRRGEAGRHASERLETQGRVIENIERGQESARSEIERLRSGPDSPERWEAEHPDARERLQAAERAFEQAVDRRALRQIEHPGEHLTRVLGERPDPSRTDEREAWQQGARAIERYRVAHEIDPAEPTALGPRPERSRARYEQLHDWEAVGRDVVEARERLGIGLPGLGTIEERMVRIAGIMPERDIARSRDLGRDLGWGR
ncbi:MAG: ATP-dependent DNA helicase, partial [Solirubrobacteraceae bacterium]